jgi:hypothetical protein
MSERWLLSSPFPSPYVRVRGRISRSYEVEWHYCVPTFKPPKAIHPGNTASYKLTSLDGAGAALVEADVEVIFQAADQERATFVLRLPYRPEAARITLSKEGRTLSEYVLPGERPMFELEVIGTGPEATASTLRLRWRRPAGAAGPPLNYLVRYSPDSIQWYRPGVNLRGDGYDLEFGEMPGSTACRIQVIATNGYHADYVELPPVTVPEKPPEVMLVDDRGPLLNAQGSSREHGPITGQGIEWWAGGARVGVGGLFPVKTLGNGIHEISVRVIDRAGQSSTRVVGRYQGESGAKVSPRPGL